MPRLPRRSLPPVLDDPRTAALTTEQERTLVLLPFAVDDHGRALDAVGTINGVIWGARWREHPPEALNGELDALAEAGFIRRYEIDGVAYLQVLDWSEQQVVSRAASSLYPPPPQGTRSRSGSSAGDALWGSVEGLVNVVAGAAEKLHDPGVQAQGVRLLADLAGQLDPSLAGRVRERAGAWVGTFGAEPPVWDMQDDDVTDEPVAEVTDDKPVADPPVDPLS